MENLIIFFSPSPSYPVIKTETLNILTPHHSPPLPPSITHPVVPGPPRPLPVSPPVCLGVEEMVLICRLTGSVHVQRGPVRPAAAPAHTPHLPLVAGEDVEEILLLHHLGHRDKHPVVGMALEQLPTPDTAVGRTEDLRFVLHRKM